MKSKSWSEAALTLGFFGGLMVFFSRPLFLISDFWWHLANGKWLVEHRSFPTADPFSLLPHADAGLREALVLKGYWLAQCLYYQVYTLAGMYGAVTLKAMVFTAIVFVIWRLLLAREATSSQAVLLLVPLAIYLRKYDELRPHLWSFLFFALLLLLLEQYRLVLHEEKSSGGGLAVGIIFLMGLWANMHTGFVLGVGLLGLAMLTETFRFLRHRQPLLGARFRTFAVTASLALMAPLVNPNGLLIYKVLLVEGVAGKFSTTVTEYDPVWRYFARLGEPQYVYLLGGLLVTTLILSLLNRNKAKGEEFVLFVVFALAGFSQFRYSVFFVMVATLVLGRVLSGVTVLHQRNLLLFGRGLVAATGLAFCLVSYPESALARGPLALGSAERAVAFVKEQQLPGPLFTPYEWGGYLQWTLFPDYKFFVDPRAIDYAHYVDYREVVQGRKAQVFERYKFNTVIFYLYPPNLEQIPSLVFSLLKDDDWQLLYGDGGVVIFSRQMTDTMSPLDKARFMAMLAEGLAGKVAEAPGKVEYLLDLAQLNYVRNDLLGAKLQFEKALRIDPGNQFAQAWVKHLEGR